MNTESQQIQRLRERFKSSMPEKANLLTQHLHVLLDHEEPIPEAYEAIKEDVHKLAGSLGMYCLLYTSPSPRDRTRSRMPSSA